MQNRHGCSAKCTGTRTASHHVKSIQEARDDVKSRNKHETERAALRIARKAQ